jgi:hypothetical protein
MSNVNANGLKSGVVTKTMFRDQFSDWSQFKTVYYAATNGVGFQIGTTEWDNLDAHLAGGGNVLYTSSIALGVYYNSNNDSYMDLWRNHFHIEPDPYRTGASNSWGTLTGVGSDAIGDGLSATSRILMQNLRIALPTKRVMSSVHVHFHNQVKLYI